MNVKSLQAVLKEFAQSFQAATIFPAILAVSVNFHFVLPNFIELDTSSASSTVVTVAAVLALSYTFYAFNSPLIRFFEGYRLKYGRCLPSLFPELLDKKRTKFTQIEKEIVELQEQRLLTPRSFQKRNHIEAELSRLEVKYEFEYPATLEKVLPTRLGNTIAAFEDYPGKRYGMDAIALWPRLVPLLKEKGHLSAVAQEKAIFDFMLYTCIVVIGVGIELFCVNLFFGEVWPALVIIVIFGLIAIIMYEGLIRSAKQWGQAVRISFDLYRHDLHERLGLFDVDSFPDEYDQWASISRFFLFRRNYRQYPSLMTYKAVRDRELKKTTK
jgi:hypothetical protein